MASCQSDEEVVKRLDEIDEFLSIIGKQMQKEIKNRKKISDKLDKVIESMENMTLNYMREEDEYFNYSTVS